jgi:hypothetical protein
MLMPLASISAGSILDSVRRMRLAVSTYSIAIAIEDLGVGGREPPDMCFAAFPKFERLSSAV